ncbi:MAG: TIGR03960 family B12-binding radical SAM protein [Planctomycetia bacterium]|nr:TIGR03960 family B12-binding radical SAM protein [Planctomycetia bacterium]
MLNESLKTKVTSLLLADIQTPGQYVGGELNARTKDHRAVRGTVCLAFPDAYAIGMSHHGLHVLYDVMNRRDDWACERAFTPWPDMERLLRDHALPLYSLETFTPLAQFDVLGFTLQYDLCGTNLLTMLDLGGIPLRADRRTLAHPLVIAGGPCVGNPEPMSPFVDLFVLGDGEEMLPRVCDAWIDARACGDREEALARLAGTLPHVYVPRFYEPSPEGVPRPRPGHESLPRLVAPAVVEDLDAVPLPTRPVVPFVEIVQDRIAIEIMRGCPWHCRFCQSSPIKRPLRFRRVDTIVEAAWESYLATGYDEISLLSLSTSDYPQLAELIERLQATFRPLGVSIAVPSLRVNEQLRELSTLLNTDRRSSLTIAPEAARDDLRRQIGKQITNEDLLAGCRGLFEQGFDRVKLYFMCGLPGERDDDLDGIVELAETISRLGKEVRGRFAKVTVSVSNFVPKPHTPYQWQAMQTREYFDRAHQYLRTRRRSRSIDLKYHDVESSLLEGIVSRGDRRVGEAIELAWRRGARFDAWSEHLRTDIWWQALAEAGVDVHATLHQPRTPEQPLPWEHVGIRQGRDYLVGQWDASRACLAEAQQ